MGGFYGPPCLDTPQHVQKFRRGDGANSLAANKGEYVLFKPGEVR